MFDEVKSVYTFIHYLWHTICEFLFVGSGVVTIHLLSGQCSGSTMLNCDRKLSLTHQHVPLCYRLTECKIYIPLLTSILLLSQLTGNNSVKTRYLRMNCRFLLLSVTFRSTVSISRRPPYTFSKSGKRHPAELFWLLVRALNYQSFLF